jgi:hypothetical protein
MTTRAPTGKAVKGPDLLRWALEEEARAVISFCRGAIASGDLESLRRVQHAHRAIHGVRTNVSDAASRLLALRFVERVIEAAGGESIPESAVLKTIIEMLGDVADEFERLKIKQRDRDVLAQCLEGKRSPESLTAWLLLRAGALNRPRLPDPSADDVRDEVKLLKKDRHKVRV